MNRAEKVSNEMLQEHPACWVDKSMKQIAWEAWKEVTDRYETHSIHEELERIEFEKWYNKQIEP